MADFQTKPGPQTRSPIKLKPNEDGMSSSFFGITNMNAITRTVIPGAEHLTNLHVPKDKKVDIGALEIMQEMNAEAKEIARTSKLKIAKEFNDIGKDVQKKSITEFKPEGLGGSNSPLKAKIHKLVGSQNKLIDALPSLNSNMSHFAKFEKQMSGNTTTNISGQLNDKYYPAQAIKPQNINEITSFKLCKTFASLPKRNSQVARSMNEFEDAYEEINGTNTTLQDNERRKFSMSPKKIQTADMSGNFVLKTMNLPKTMQNVSAKLAKSKCFFSSKNVKHGNFTDIRGAGKLFNESDKDELLRIHAQNKTLLELNNIGLSPTKLAMTGGLPSTKNLDLKTQMINQARMKVADSRRKRSVEEKRELTPDEKFEKLKFDYIENSEMSKKDGPMYLKKLPGKVVTGSMANKFKRRISISLQNLDDANPVAQIFNVKQVNQNRNEDDDDSKDFKMVGGTSTADNIGSKCHESTGGKGKFIKRPARGSAFPHSLHK